MRKTTTDKNIKPMRCNFGKMLLSNLYGINEIKLKKVKCCFHLNKLLIRRNWTVNFHILLNVTPMRKFNSLSLSFFYWVISYILLCVVSVGKLYNQHQ